ncbi:vesicle-associated membrane protein 4-like [Littorina saxatilis]|uniref:V-SNARE coiled-coil homology domain-containing protein n=1 Tax=Littorina saxatilis TaxID=31220 RepID=A0AAN9B7E2_9CAEN
MAGRTENLGRLEADVSEVTHLLKDNVEKVIERGERIDDLQTRSEELQSGSHHFSRRATQVRRKMCWQNCRMNCIIAFVILGILAVIAIIVVVTMKPWEDSSSGHGNNSTVNALPSIPSD